MDPPNVAANLPPLFSDQEMIIMSVIIALSLTGLLLNAMLIFLLCWNPKRTLERTYLVCVLNLACTDFIVCLILVYFSVEKALQKRAYEQYAQCAWDALFNSVTGIYSLWSIMLLAVDRFFIVVMQQSLSLKKILLFVVINLMVSFGTGCSPLFFPQATDVFIVMPAGTYCFVDLGQTGPELGSIAYAMSISYILALAVTLLSYMKIMYVILKGNATLQVIKEMGRLVMQDTQKTLPSKEQSASYRHSSSMHATLSFSQRWRTSFHVQNENGGPLESSPRGSQSFVGNISSNQKKPKRTSELGIALRTVFMGCTYILFYIPFAIYGICQMCGYQHLKTMDIVSMLCIVCSPIMDPFWTLFLDKHVNTSLDEVIDVFQKWILK